MKYFILSSLILASLTLQSSYANEEYNAVVVDGPGVLSGKDGSFKLDILGTKKNLEETSTESKTTKVLNENEFELFKLWQETKKNNNADYQEFLDWRAYLQYKRANQ